MKKDSIPAADCAELDECQVVGAIFRHHPGARENLLSPETETCG